MEPDNWTNEAWLKVKSVIENSEHDYRPEFVYWLSKNFQVWQAFVEQTKIAFKVQHRARFSARQIVESVRWNSAVSESSSLFKISNNYIPDMARLIMELHEPLKGFFETRSNAARERGMCKIL